MRPPTAKALRELVEALVRKHCDGAPPESRLKYRGQLATIARFGYLLDEASPVGEPTSGGASAREATGAELAALWNVDAGNEAIEQCFDGDRRWAFLVRFVRSVLPEALRAGSVGAIVHGEDRPDGPGVRGAWLYSTPPELERAWSVVRLVWCSRQWHAVAELEKQCGVSLRDRH
jgi:hypothetical protein